MRQLRQMDMSLNHSNLSKPTSGEKVPAGTLIYFRMRNRQRLWEMVVNEFERNGITQAELCRRIGRDPSKVSALLNSPSNIEIDTLSDFLFGISAAQPTYGLVYPLDGAPRNYTQPEWLTTTSGLAASQSGTNTLAVGYGSAVSTTATSGTAGGSTSFTKMLANV